VDARLILLSIIVLIAHAAEAISGFGSTVISVTSGANFYPIDTLVPTLIPLNLLLSGYIVFRYHANIDRSLLLKRILPFMGIGLAVGLVIFNMARGPLLKIALGGFVLVVSLRELVRLLRKKEGSHPRPKSMLLSTLLMIGGGIIHGIYASGGPMLVYSISHLSLGKKAFRSTLSTVWLILNIVLAVSHIQTGKINLETIKISAVLFPTLPLGIVTGEWLHHRINERIFRIIVFSLLIVAGISLMM
jgi:uncharacterized membrane protein YfcA